MDSTYALLLLGIFAFSRQYPKPILEAMLKMTRPGATILLLLLVVYCFYKRYTYTALALTLISTYLLRDLWVFYPESDARRLYMDIGRDQARFDPSSSIDIQFADGTVVHETPVMLRKDKDVSPLLVFPPTEEQLREISGQ
jgi:hypothetical protein